MYAAAHNPLSASDVDLLQEVGDADRPQTDGETSAMTIDEIRQTIADYAARRSQRGRSRIRRRADPGQLSLSAAQFLNRTTNRRTDEYGGGIENRARILFEVVEAVLGEVEPSLVGVKISPMHESGPMAAHDETLPMAEYAIRELGGYGLSQSLADGEHHDFTGTPLEPLMGDGMFRHFRPIFRGTLIANVNMTAERGNHLIADGLADMVAFAGPISPILIWSSGSRPVPRSPRSTGQPSTARAGAAIPTTRPSVMQWPDAAKIKETDMGKTTPEQNKELVLEAFDTLFNKRDYAAAERFWSDRYIQAQRPHRARPRRAVRPDPHGSGDTALREPIDSWRRRLRHRARPLLRYWPPCGLDRCRHPPH